VKTTVDSAKDALDHRYLNEIAGLELPTLETIAIWLWRRIAPDLPALAEIGIYRDSCGEGCEYQGEFETLEEAAENILPKRFINDSPLAHLILETYTYYN
ncbi:6-carboxytetrahydropterin synthase, partial [Mycobacterium tuberculosis]|nr:6-carboxytetrahydropterin synthase [Mycobacterium tuberculosis]